MKQLNFTLLKKSRPLLMVFFSLLLSDIVIGQITHVTGSPQSANNTSSTLTITKPSGLQVGDIMIANIIQTDNDGNSLSNASRTNWTVIDGRLIGTSGNDDWWGTLLYKFADAADVAASDFAFTLDTDAGDGNIGAIVAFRGVDNTTPFDVAPGTFNLTTSDDLSASSITTVTANAAVVMFGMNADNEIYSSWQTATGPLSLTELYEPDTDNGPDKSIGAAWAIKASPGSTGLGTAEISGNDDEFNAAILIALRPALAPPPTTLTPIGCNGQFYASHGSNGSFNSQTFLETLSFSGPTITANPYQSVPTNIGYNGIGLNPTDGFIYGLRYPGSGEKVRLIIIGNQVPPVLNNILELGTVVNADLSTEDNVYAGCFDADGKFFFISEQDELFSISGLNYPTVNLTATKVGNVTTSGFFVDIAIDPTDGQMYGVTDGQIIYKINKANGTLTNVGTHSGSSIFGLFFNEIGNLYGYQSNGTFQLINKTNASLTQTGTGPSYSYADGCSCSFGTVFHTLDAPNGICPTVANPNPTFNITVSVKTQSSSQKIGLIYTLVIPSKRFSFNETAAAIQTKLFNLGLLPNNNPGAHVTISTTVTPTGASNNKLVVTSFRTGNPGSTVNFDLNLIVSTPGGPDESIQLQSVISGLPVLLGEMDDSDDPATPAPNDPTIIEMCEQSTLPVKLISFTGTYKNDETSLNWVVEDQVNFSHYDIQRSADGNSYSTVGSKTKQGSSTSRESYNFRDNLSSVNGNTFFYRLKIVDIDGNFKYSNVILIRKDQQAITGINFSPNPVIAGETAVVRFMSNSTTSVDLRVVDMSGRVVLRQQNFVSEGTNSITINNLDRLQTGMYVLQVNNAKTIQITRFNIVR